MKRTFRGDSAVSRIAAGLFMLLIVGGVNASAQDFDALDEVRRIRENHELWQTAFSERDTTRLFALYGDESIMISGGGVWNGLAECKNLIRTLFTTRPDITWDNTVESIEVFKAWGKAYESGVWAEKWTETGDSEKSEVRGRYWLMYTLENDRWIIHSWILTPLSCEGSYCDK